MPLASGVGGALGVALLFLLPTAAATIVFTPLYNPGCNGNPYGTGVQYPPIGSTARTLHGPTLAGGFVAPGVSGAQSANSSGPGAALSSAIQTAEYFMVGPRNPNASSTCYTPSATHGGVTATFTWNVSWSAYLGANCTGSASAASSYDVYVVGNFHQPTPPFYLVTPVSPARTVSAFDIGCGGPFSSSGRGTFSVTTPGVTVLGGTSYDFYTAIWVYTQTQESLPTGSTASAFSGVSWNATFSGATCTCP